MMDGAPGFKTERPVLRRRLRSRTALPATLWTCAVLATGCDWQKPRPPSILVIAVEQLGFNAFSCGEEGAEDGNGGYAAFCAEAVRFTHAYAPSPLSQPSIASILTGRYPYQHGVRHNGAQSLPDGAPNVAKSALARGYRTAFFSGGPPIFRKSGFNAGFETFDDAFSPTPRALYRPALETVRQFLSWKDADAPRSSFFAVLYLPDLQFPDAVTVNALGEARDHSWKSQNLEVNETLGLLVRELKSRKAWDDSSVFLAGLNSHQEPEEERDGEIRPLNLYSESLRVRLMIKPARRSGRESPFNWKVDSNVSLVDLGATVFELLGEPPPRCDDPDDHPGPAACGGQAAVASLKSVLDGPQPSWRADRAILAESAWAAWQGIGTIRYALRQGPYLFLPEGRGKLINAFMDPLETAVMREDDARGAELRASFALTLSTLAPEAWRAPAPSALEAISLGSRLWQPTGPSPEAVLRLRALSAKDPLGGHLEGRPDGRLAGWRASVALKQENWNDLRAVGEKSGHPMWAYVAALNMGLKPPAPDEPCLRLFRSAKSGASEAPFVRDCASAGVMELIAWTDEAASAAQKTKAQEAFLRARSLTALDDAVAERNYALDLTWDVSPHMTRAPRAVDLLLALPENRKYRSALNRRAE